jgi:glycosyltransferase involved in cell wall biosynthesis
MDFFFSIIIPVYKDQERLLSLLDSLNSQTFDFEQWEVIVVNNDPESSLEIKGLVSPLYKFTVVDEKIPGSYAARNKGIKEAKGEILAFTDSDCLPDKKWLENAHKIFENDLNRNIGILTGPIPLFYRNRSNLSDAEVYEKYTGFTTESYAREGKAVTANWFSYSKVIHEFGGFNSELKSNGDSELSGKISSKYLVVYREEIKVNHPARFYTEELVNKYQRLLGGTYTRNYKNRNLKFLGYLGKFVFRRYRFAFKKFLTIGWSESKAVFKVCHAINKGTISEYFKLIKGAPTAR